MSDSPVGNSTTTHFQIGPPKYQGTVPELARSELDIGDLEYEKGERAERVVLKAELEVVEVKETKL